MSTLLLLKILKKQSHCNDLIRHVRSTVLLIGLLFLASCGNGEEQTKTTKYRVVKNGSSHQVAITITANKQYQYQLGMGDSVIFEGYVKSGIDDYSYIGWNDSKPITGKIVFDNEREIIIYSNASCESGRNPLNPYVWELHSCGYVNKDSNHDGESEYVFIIDDSDYDIATPIVN